MGDSLQWETSGNRALFELGDVISIPTDDPDEPLQLPRTLVFSDQFLPRLNQVFDYARRADYPDIESDLGAVLNLNSGAERETLITFYRRIRRFIEEGRDHVWFWFISNLMQPVRLAQSPVSRLVGNPPWVVYNAMADDRQDAFRKQAQDRKVWAGAYLATQNDLAATFVATCVDYYLKPGGKFGFVLPYGALRARQWAPFRKGEWSLPQNAGRRPTLVDLSKEAWDFLGVNAPPFPQANSSVVFGLKLNTSNRGRQVKSAPLSSILSVSNAEPVNTRMPWGEVRPKLIYTKRQEMNTAPSEAYENAFRNGATLFPQPLVVFEQPKSRAMGKVYFKTNSGKGAWNGLERDGRVEEQFVKPALFSRLLLPFGMAGQSNIVAPFAQDGISLEIGLPQENEAAEFRLYWDNADHDWRRLSGPRPPDTLLDQIDHQGKLSSQLALQQKNKVVYQRSGTWLMASVIQTSILADGTLNWYASDDSSELHYLTAIFNAPCLAKFFRDHCRASDRHFQMGPVENLPIAKFEPGNKHHQNLANQSMVAHKRVAELVNERLTANRKIGRRDVLEDQAMRTFFVSIDESVHAILPDYCS